MANWKEVTERWLPIVENMEEHSMDDYAIPEIYRAAEREIEQLRKKSESADRLMKAISDELRTTKETNDD